MHFPKITSGKHQNLKIFMSNKQESIKQTKSIQIIFLLNLFAKKYTFNYSEACERNISDKFNEFL